MIKWREAKEVTNFMFAKFYSYTSLVCLKPSKKRPCRHYMPHRDVRQGPNPPRRTIMHSISLIMPDQSWGSIYGQRTDSFVEQ